MATERAADVAHPYVVRHSDVQGGQAVIKDSRFPVSTIVQNYRRGLSVDEILQEFPWLRPEEVHDALSYWYDHRAEVDAEISTLTDLDSVRPIYPPTLPPAPHDGD
jgi:uncharacterized protein (DUF433 family)